MSDINNGSGTQPAQSVSSAPKDFEKAASELCEKALNEARAQLHPLLMGVALDRLDRRYEFVQAFKSALELRIARKLADWLPGVQAVFRFDESMSEYPKSWDGSIRLLVKVPRLSNAVRNLSKKLDQKLVKYLSQVGWSRFRKRQSILEIHQVTPNELRRGVSYGAMFFSAYNVPVKVWPRDQRSGGM